MPTSTGREEIFIENGEETIRVTRRSLSQLSMVENKISLEFLTLLDAPSKGHPQGVYIDTKDDPNPSQSPIVKSAPSQRNKKLVSKSKQETDPF